MGPDHVLSRSLRSAWTEFVGLRSMADRLGRSGKVGCFGSCQVPISSVELTPDVPLGELAVFH